MASCKQTVARDRNRVSTVMAQYRVHFEVPNDERGIYPGVCPLLEGTKWTQVTKRCLSGPNLQSKIVVVFKLQLF